MGKSIAKIGSFKVPAHLQQEAVHNEDFVTTTTGAPVARLVAKKGKFYLKDKEGEMSRKGHTEVNAIILAASPAGKAVSKVYYEKGYESDEAATAPDCSSADGVHPDVVVDEPISTRCVDCPMNEWGSGKNGKGKACRDVKKIYLVAPDNIEENEIVELRLAPTSLRPMSLYAAELGKHGVPMHGAITKISFVDDPSLDYDVLEFSVSGFLDVEGFEAATKRRDEDELLDSLVVKPSGNKKPAPAAKPAAVEEEDDDEEEEEAPTPPPATKKKAAKKKAAKKAAPPEEELSDDGDDDLSDAETEKLTGILGTWD